MTPEEHRALDVEVAEKIMHEVPCGKWQVQGHSLTAGAEYVKMDGQCEHEPLSCYPEQMGAPPYSTSIAAAWTVWEAMSEEHSWYLCMMMGGDYEIGYRDFSTSSFGPPIYRTLVIADTAPLAICQAALKTVEETP